MKKLIIILALLLPFFGFSQIQDEYYRVADWTFYPDSVIQLTDTTYSVYATPANYNDPGAIERIVGNYVVDFVGHRYIVIDSTSTYLTLYDIYHTGQAPQTGQIAHCYRSVGNGEAQFIGSVDYSTLDESARWKINGADNELMWQRVEDKVPYSGAKRDVDLGANSISTDTVKIDGVPLLLNTFKQGNLGGASNIFYSTGASSQPASGSLNQVVGGGLLNANSVVKWDGSKFANSGIQNTSGGHTSFGSLVSGIDQTISLFSDTENNFIRFISAGNYSGFFSYGNQDMLFGNQGFGAMKFNTNATFAGIINTSQFWGIGTELPTEKMDVNGNLIADILKSRVTTGTPPLVVASSTKVDSLNVGLLDGKKASDFQLKSDTTTFDATLSDLQDSASAIRALANTKAVVSGTDNYIMKKTGANTLGNSTITDNGSIVATILPIFSNISVAAPTHYAGSSYWDSNYFKLGYGQTGNRIAAIDLTGDDTYSDYGFRLIRGIAGANANSRLEHRGNGSLLIRTIDSGRLVFLTKSTTAVVIDTLQNSGFGTQTPAARIHSESTTTQARLGYDATKYTDLSTGSTGNLTITPSGGDVIVAGDIVGDSIRAANFKMSTGAGKNKVMMSDSFGNGYWAEALGVPEVGDYYGGGQVYYVSPSGTYGYCVYLSVIFQGTTYWSPSGTTTIASNLTLGAGITNTTAIVSTFGAGNYAAYKVDTLTIGGYSDWALPSAGDADMIHDSLYSTFESSSLIYLANDEGNVGKAYVWNTGTYQNQFMKGTAYSDLSYKVIAVRRFTISTQSFNLAVSESDGSPNYSAINTIQFANSVLSQPANNTVLVTPNSMNGDQIVAALNANDSTTLTKALAAPQLIMTGTSYNYLWSQYYNNAYDYGIYLTQAPKGGYSDLLKFDAFNKIFYIPKLNLELGGYANNIGTGAATGSSTTKLATEDLVVKTIAASGGGSMVYPGAGIPVSTGSAWGTSITNNSTNWNNAYTYRLTGASGTSPLTLSLSANNLTGSLSSQLTSIGTLSPSIGYLYYNGSTFSYATPSGTSKWTADTYGINYQSGNVGIGVTSNQSNKLRVETSVTSAHAIVGVSSSGIAVVGSSTSGEGVHGDSQSNNAVSGISGTGNGIYGTSSTGFGGLFEGLGCKATKFYVSSLNTAPASSTATGTTGEIRFTSDYIYVCVATNTWKRTQISTW